MRNLQWSAAALALALGGPALAAVGTAVWLALAAGWFRGVRSVPVLREAEREPLGLYPSISVIVPARNEEEAVEEALGSLLAQEYPGRLEVVVVDDRSTDATPEVLAGLASRWPERLRVVRVEELPHGWLGKNHALYVGAALVVVGLYLTNKPRS